jgi:ActR/RegA family two-component response regulator
MPPVCDRCAAAALFLSPGGRPLCADCATADLATRAASPRAVLNVEDSEPFAYALRRRVEHGGGLAEVTASAAGALVSMRDHAPDVVICDHNLAGPMSGAELLELVRVLYPATRRVL